MIKMTAALSYTSQFGWYGLRVNPTFDQVLKTVRKPLRIPVPDRSAKWYALSLERSAVLDAEDKYQDYEHTLIDYRRSGQELPESAARVRRSDAGLDPTFDEIHAHADAMENHHQAHVASQIMQADRRRRTEENRTQVLYETHAHTLGDPVISAYLDEMDAAEVHYTKPAPKSQPIKSYQLEPVRQWAAGGYPQAPEFTPFGELNLAEPHRVHAANPQVGQATSYDRLKEAVADQVPTAPSTKSRAR